MASRRVRTLIRSRAWLVLAAGCLLASCSEKPKAPPLSNEAVYQNESIGLRFLTPAGWSVASRSDLPSGPLSRPATVVSYMQTQASAAAEFEVVAADLPEEADLGEFLAGHRIGGGKWTRKPPDEPVTVNGVEATRFTLTRIAGKTEFHREGTAFRRGGRVYFFILTFSTRDPDRRDQARKAVESITWTR